MDSGSEEQDDAPVEQELTGKRGRPVGKVDQTKRFRRTAQEISDDKIKVAQMKLDALRETEEKRLANKKPRARAARVAIQETTLAPAPKNREAERQRSESPPHPIIGTRRQALYDSWFPSSPRAKNY